MYLNSKLLLITFSFIAPSRASCVHVHEKDVEMSDEKPRRDTFTAEEYVLPAAKIAVLSVARRPLLHSFFFFFFFLTTQDATGRRDDESQRVVRRTAGDSQVLESIIYMDRNGTCLLDLDPGRGRGTTAAGTSDRGQYRISLAGVLWKFVRAAPSIQ